MSSQISVCMMRLRRYIFILSFFIMHNRITDCAISIIFLIEVGIPVTHGDYISIKMKDY